MEKQRRTKVLVLSTLVVVVATLSIAFAAMSRTLSINGIAKMDTASWDVHFDNLGAAVTTGGAKEEGKPNINKDDEGILENIKVRLSNPKDEISYTVDIVNEGTIDAEITMIKDIELTDVQKKIFEFKVTYTGTPDILKNGDLLPAGDTKNITITIRFRDDITEFDLPTESQTINLSYQLTYTQYDGSEIVIEPDGGDFEVVGNSILAHDVEALFATEEVPLAPFFNGTLSRNVVETITFVNNTNVPTEASSTAWDASEAKDGSIIAWYQEGVTEGLYDVYIGCNNKIYLPIDCTAIFAFFMSLKEINNIQLLDTSNVTNMFYFFAACEQIQELNLSTFDTSNVVSMYGMFTVCANLTTLLLDNWDTSNVTDMYYMFDECLSLTSLDLSSFDTSNVTRMDSMFESCESLISLNLSSFDTSKVTNMSLMFAYCKSLTSLNLSSWDASEVTDMGGMFRDCSELMNLNLTGFKTKEVTNMALMFTGCEKLTNIDLSLAYTSKVTGMAQMFDDCSSLITIKFNSADFSKVTDTMSMFENTPDNITVYVKDETSKDFILIRKINANVIIEPLAS